MLRLARTAAILATFSAVVVYGGFQFLLNRPIFPEITPGLTGSPQRVPKESRNIFQIRFPSCHLSVFKYWSMGII